jgi:hypothetical protein
MSLDFSDVEKFRSLGVTASELLGTSSGPSSKFEKAKEGVEEGPTNLEDTPSSKIREIVQQSADDRVYFCEKVLGIKLEKWQQDVMERLDAGETRISIRSGNGVGKTALCSLIALHFLLFRIECKVVVTSPSASQLKDGLFPETLKWAKELPTFLKKFISNISDRIVRKDNSDNAFISFRTARRETPEALAGIHSKYVLCIVDEASGVAEEVYEAAQGTLSTKDAIFILIGNPTRLSGYFYRTHNDLSPYWYTRIVTSFDTTRVDQAFIDTIVNTYGEDSDQYRVKVLGQFPLRESESLIAKDIVQAAVDRDIDVPLHEEVTFGLDVGRGGDPSALVGRKGAVVFFAQEYRSKDAMKTVGWVIENLRNLPDHHQPDTIFVDSIGMGGPVADRLREQDFPAVDLNVGEQSSLKGTYLRLRDEIAYAAKYWYETLEVKIDTNLIIQYGGTDQIVKKFVEEASGPLALFTSTGKNAVEQKRDMKKRGLNSPNLFDAHCLTFSREGALLAGALRNKNSDWNKPLDVVTDFVY